MDSLWHKLQEEVVSFKSATEEKRRIYNDLLAKDKKGVAEVAENNKKIQKLMVKQISLVNHSRYLLKIILVNGNITIIICWNISRKTLED